MKEFVRFPVTKVNILDCHFPNVFFRVLPEGTARLTKEEYRYREQLFSPSVFNQNNNVVTERTFTDFRESKFFDTKASKFECFTHSGSVLIRALKPFIERVSGHTGGFTIEVNDDRGDVLITMYEYRAVYNISWADDLEDGLEKMIDAAYETYQREVETNSDILNRHKQKRIFKHLQSFADLLERDLKELGTRKTNEDGEQA